MEELEWRLLKWMMKRTAKDLMVTVLIDGDFQHALSLYKELYNQIETLAWMRGVLLPINNHNPNR